MILLDQVMIPHDAGRHPETRRQFIKKSGAVAAAVAGASLFDLPALARENTLPVAIVLEAEAALVQAPPVRWAAEQLRDALAARGITARICANQDEAPPAAEYVLVTSGDSPVARRICQAREIVPPATPESFALARGKNGTRTLLVAGADPRGLVYALLELADRVSFAADPLTGLTAVPPLSERPANAIRSLARAFVSDVEDQAWFQDRSFWSRYLTLLAAQRFNRFHLMFGVGYDFTTDITDCYFHFAYPFLLAVPGYNVRAVPLPDAERDLNLELLKFISDEAARRGLHFQLGLWTHAWQWTRSPKANYLIEGLTPETHAPYCRDALRAVLAACPNINGVTFRIHGESGVPEGNYGLWKTIFDGVAQCGRRVEIDMHAKGMDQAMVEVALGTGMPVNISPKFWAEHMGLPYMQGAIRAQEMPPRNARTTGFFSRSSGARSFLRYGYGDLFAEDRRYGILHRMWPGTQRLLAWGDPEMAAAYGRVAGFCGGAGLELMEPLTFKGRKGSGLPGGRDAYADAALTPAHDFEKYRYTYRVWGRSLYHPDGDAEGRRRWLGNQFGRGAEAMEYALASAGRILPLVVTAHCPSAANNNYWPEMYFNMPIVEASRTHPYGDTPSPKRLGTVSPLDPEFFLGLDEFAGELLQQESSGKYSPAWVAAQLDAAAETAAQWLRQAKAKTPAAMSAEFRRLALDVTIQAGLGKFFAAKFRAGVLFALYRRTNHRGALEQALETNRAARAAWAGLADAAKGLYREDITFGPEYFQRGHWLDRLPAMDADIADMEQLLTPTTPGPTQTRLATKLIEQAMHAILTKPAPDEPPSHTGWHTPPPSFRRGQPLAIVAQLPPSGSRAAISAVHLRYRHVNQAESWQTLAMEKTGGDHHAVISAEYTDSLFPLQYHFQIHAGSGPARLHPGLHPGWRGQPYFVVRQA